MKKIWFYFAVGVGLAAFVTLIAVYSYKTSQKTFDNEVNQLDLNASKKGDIEITIDKADASTDGTSKNDTNSNKDNAITDATNADKNTDNKNTDNKNTDNKNIDNQNTKTNNVTNGDNTNKEKLNSEKANNNTTTEDTTDIENPDTTAEALSGGASPVTLDVDPNYNGEKYLMKPVEGENKIPFSMDTTVYFETMNSYKCSDALYISADVDSFVSSAYTGEVTSVSSNPVYGTMVVVNIGNGYELSYGQLKDVKVSVGQTVSLGDEIGRVAEPTGYFSVEGSHLYFKMTKDGNPVNPEEYYK